MSDRYLKITVSGPYVNTDQVTYVKVNDTFEKDSKADEDLIEEAVWGYVESWSELMLEGDVPEEERW